MAQNIDESLLVYGVECVISPDAASESGFAATLEEITYNDDGTVKFYVFTDMDGDYWDCELREIDEILE